jgi:TRAP-type C4-dicarboxylate transport system permease small subunit
VAAVIGLAICLVLLYATSVLVFNSARFASRSIQPSATPLLWPQLIVPIGYALLSLAYVEELVRRACGLPPRREDDEPDVSIS